MQCSFSTAVISVRLSRLYTTVADCQYTPVAYKINFIILHNTGGGSRSCWVKLEQLKVKLEKYTCPNNLTTTDRARRTQGAPTLR